MHPATLDSEIPPGLISEIARGAEDPSTIFRRYGYTNEEAYALAKNEDFKRALSAARNAWDRADNVKERIRTKSLFALEELLRPHFALAVDPDVSPSARNDAVKIFKGLAGLDTAAEVSGGGGNGFQITLNLGAGLEREIVLTQQPEQIEVASED